MHYLFNRMGRFEFRIVPAGLACGAGFLSALWVGLILAETGHFSAWLALSAAAVAAVIVWRHYRWRVEEHLLPDTNRRGLLAAIVLALLSLVITVPPSEIILGGWDPGVYVHTAAVVARDGGLSPEYSDLSALTPESRALISRQYGEVIWEPFPGMRMLPNGHISPQGYHLYPVTMALLWPFGGVKAALMVNPLLNALSIVLLYLWACRWVRPRWAFAAALGLALNPAQVWQAGFPTSELLAQCLLLIGLVATDRALSGRTRDGMDAILAGAAFGLMLLTRYDSILFVVPFMLVLLTALRDKSKRGQLVTLLCTTAALGVQLWFHQHYIARLYRPMGGLVERGLWVAGILALLIIVLAFLNPLRTGHNKPAASHWLTGLRVAALAGLILWVFLNWYVRPHLTVDGRVLRFITSIYPEIYEADWYPLIAGRNARNFWYLKSLFGAAGLVAAFTGIGIMIFRTRTTWRTAWLAAALGVTLMLMTMIYHEPFMMFAARRMVPVIIPMLCIGVAALCSGFESVMRMRPRLGRAAASLAFGLTLAGTLGGALYMADHREWPGLVNWYDQLVEEIPGGALVYSDQPGFAAPLRFIYGIQAYELYTTSNDQRAAAMVMMMKKAENNSIFWLTKSGVPELYSAYAGVTATLPLSSVILGTTKHDVPRYLRARGGLFTLYRIKPGDLSSGASHE